MPAFNFQAADAAGAVRSGVMEAPDSATVIERLRKESFFPIVVEPREAARFQISLPSFGKRISAKELLNFTRQMATLLRSGLELDRCLVILQDLTDNRKTREIVRAIQKGVHEGDTLSAAMAKQKEAFPLLYLNMVKAGEAGGFLERVFERLGIYLAARLKLVDSVRSALIYPAVLALSGLGAIAVLMVYVIPKFARIFEGLGGELPATTRFLVWFSNTSTVWLPGTVMLGVAAGFGLNRYLATRSGRLKWDSLALRLPVVGPLVKKSVVAQFTRVLGTLLQSGVPITHALAIVKETVPNLRVGQILEKTARGMKEGRKISDQLRESGIFPPLAVHMILVGEESGTLEEMLLQVAQIYDDEVEVAVKRAITLLEPAMILLMGLVVAFVVVSMLTAIFSVNDLPM